jgi:hypothetical protein
VCVCVCGTSENKYFFSCIFSVTYGLKNKTQCVSLSFHMLGPCGCLMEEQATWEFLNCCTCIMHLLFKAIIFISVPMHISARHFAVFVKCRQIAKHATERVNCFAYSSIP